MVETSSTTSVAQEPIVGPKIIDAEEQPAGARNGANGGEARDSDRPDPPALDTIAEEGNDEEDGDDAMVGPVLPRAKKRRVRALTRPG